MKIITPSYYSKFRCTADKCSDSCCIGWEIDIDRDTYEKYLSVTGAFGQRLRENIVTAEDGSKCFKLDDDERCPFLNAKNLCDIILTLGEDHLCGICDMHPRFREWFGDRCEMGVGMCCEAAAELILFDSSPFSLTCTENSEPPDEEFFDEELYDYLFEKRQKLIEILQTDSPFPERLSEAALFAAKIQSELDNSPSSEETCGSGDIFAVLKDIFPQLEPLNEEWTEAAERIIRVDGSAPLKAPENGKIFGNMAVYFVYRYFMKAVFDNDVLSKMNIVLLSCAAVSMIMSAEKISIEKAAVLWSKEAEYSEENIDTLLLAPISCQKAAAWLRSLLFSA
ncbi:MAG: flagellin lysine-N-methylase [Huintestinicola sp.]